MRPTVHWHSVNGVFDDPVLYGDFLFEKRAILFDLGEIASLTSRKLLRVSHVFVSHAHLDHFCGFDRLLRVCLGRDKTITLLGPPGLSDRVEHKLHAYTWNLIRSYGGRLTFKVGEVSEFGTIHFAEFRSESAFERELAGSLAIEDDILISEPGFRVRGVTLDHGTPSLAFAFEETAHVNIWKDRLTKRGWPVGPWLHELKTAVLSNQPDDSPFVASWRTKTASESVTVPLGDLKCDLLTVTPGQKVAYVVDAAFNHANVKKIERLAHDADHMFIEAVFLDKDQAIAEKRRHLTARQAGEIARRAGVKNLHVLHFSSRYLDREMEIMEEATRAFRNSA